jgi:paraquat-inducible protein B
MLAPRMAARTIFTIESREEDPLMTATKKQTESQKDAAKLASREVERAEQAHEKMLAREKRALAQLKAAKGRAKGASSKRLSNAALTARQRANESTKSRIEAAAKLREARRILREQQQLVRALERKERARERAVAAFLKKWEREYDLDMQRKKKNIKLREQELQRI